MTFYLDHPIPLPASKLFLKFQNVEDHTLNRKANYNDARIEAPGNLLVNGIAGTTLPLLCFLAALVFLILGRLKQSRNYYSAALICFIITLFSALWM